MRAQPSISRRVRMLSITAVAVLISTSFLYLTGINQLLAQRADAQFDGYAAEAERGFMTFLDNIANTAKTMTHSTTIQTYLLGISPEERLRFMVPSTDLMTNLIEVGTDITDIALYSRSGRILFARGGMRTITLNMLADYNLTGDSPLSQAFFSRVYYPDPPAPQIAYAYYIEPIYNTLPGEFSNENAGICVIQFRVDLLEERLPAGRDMLVALSQGDTLLAANAQIPGDAWKALAQIPEPRGTRAILGEKSLYRKYAIPKTIWTLTSAVPTRELEKDLGPLRQRGLILFLLAAGALFLLTQANLRFMTAPIARMARDIASVRGAVAGYRMPVPQLQELAIVGEQINRMLDRIDRTTSAENAAQQALYESSVQRERAELLSYRSQINPHFLYNTLECIRSMAQSYGAECIEDICLSLSRMFRYSVRDDESVTVRDEVEHVQNYFAVMTARMDGAYRLDVRITPEAMQRHIQKVVLQPIVENTIRHAFTEKKPPWRVSLQGFVLPDGTLILRITDNGKGLSPAALTRLRALERGEPMQGDSGGGEGIGLANIDHRLRLVFGDGYRLRIRSKQGYYTSIELRLMSAREPHTGRIAPGDTDPGTTP